MINWNMHAHTNASDGDLSAEEVVRRAVDEGLAGVAITDHFPFPYRPDQPVNWAASRQAFERHLQVIETLQDKVDSLQILKGAEVEYLPSLDTLAHWLSGLDLDFVLGGTHILDGWVVDVSEEIFCQGKKHFGGFRGAIECYYEAVGELGESGLVDSIAHLDVVKKYNPQSRYFNEDEPWYRQAVERCLQRIARTGVAIEVNTAGLRGMVGDLYPSEWILRRARELDIPVTVGVDFHRDRDRVSAGLAQAETALRAAGYDGYLIFRGRRAEALSLRP
ncbi:MAG: histidinol-phosphatase [Chloroflexota bacterium]|nr:histidinol-phosphatase [Chloroflexota bacterium]